MKIATGLAGLVAAALAAAAHADFSGHTMTGAWYYPEDGITLESHTFVVGPTVELPDDDIINNSHYSIDLTGDTVTFLFTAENSWSSEPFNGWIFSDTNGTIPTISNYVMDSYSTGILNIEVVQTGFNNDAVWANFSGLAVGDGAQFIRFRATFVPAPSVGALAAIAGLVATRRRR
jgi:hypothetical protein